MKQSGFCPVDVGTAGRRAVAWFLRDGLSVTATDAGVANYAMGIVLIALDKEGREAEASHFFPWILEGAKVLPAVPDDTFTAWEYERGEVDFGEANEKVIGYAYVKPAARGCECGGAMFDGVRRIARCFDARTISLPKAK